MLRNFGPEGAEDAVELLERELLERRVGLVEQGEQAGWRKESAMKMTLEQLIRRTC